MPRATVKPYWLMLAGFWLQMASLFFIFTTVAVGGYRRVLATAIILTVTATLCFVLAFRKGGPLARIVCFVLVLPTIFVASEFIRRAPYAFGWR